MKEQRRNNTWLLRMCYRLILHYKMHVFKIQLHPTTTAPSVSIAATKHMYCNKEVKSLINSELTVINSIISLVINCFLWSFSTVAMNYIKLCPLINTLTGITEAISDL